MKHFILDEDKINEIVKIFKDSAVKKQMNANETAEMVITFIQEIPYYLVHDESCEKAVASGNSFVKQIDIKIQSDAFSANRCA